MLCICFYTYECAFFIVSNFRVDSIIYVLNLDGCSVPEAQP